MERSQLPVLLQRIENEPRRFIQVIYGPRQVGKTTLVRQLLEKAHLPYQYATADGINSTQSVWISQQWEAARIKCTHSGRHQAILVLDEIQKINNWSELVKLEWDADSNQKADLKVILLGSSRLLLQQGLTESLTGRFETMYLPHWSYAEMKELTGMKLDEYIWFGGYPGAASLIKDEARWKSYVQTAIIETSISRDILMLTRVDKPALIKQLFELGSTYSGQILSMNKMLGQLHDAGNTTTLSHYLVLLDQAGLLTGIPKYGTNKIRLRASIPKFQVHNTAFISTMANDTFNEVKNEPSRWGRWVESAIGAHLINQSHLYNFNLYYWRHENDEIDFVIKDRNKVIGLEVKTSMARQTSGMDAFKKQYKPDRTLLIGPSGIPVEEFLSLETEQLF